MGTVRRRQLARLLPEIVALWAGDGTAGEGSSGAGNPEPRAVEGLTGGSGGLSPV